MQREEYFKLWGWEKSPFIKSTSKHTPIVKRHKEHKQLEEAIGGWDRLILLTAPIGYGKTTFMNQVEKNPPKHTKYVIGFNAYEPPKHIINRIKGYFPFFKRILTQNPTQSSFGQYLELMLGQDKMLLIFDEAQDYENDIFRWLRTINDSCDNLFMLFIGLKGLEDRIGSHASLRDRKTKVLSLGALSQEELKQIIAERIKWVGGTPPKPFTVPGLSRLCELSQAVPRALLDKGQTVIEYCAKKDIRVIDAEKVDAALGSFEAPYIPAPDVFEIQVNHSASFFDLLSPTQQQIVSFLLERESASIAEIGQAIGSDMRSTGSLIRKLRGKNPKEVERKPEVPYPIVVKAGKQKRLGRLQTVFELSDNSRRLLSKQG